MSNGQPLTTVVAETKRLRLRTWADADGALLARHCNNPEVMEHLGGPMDEAGHGRLVRWLHQQYANHGTTFWVVERRDDGEFLGFCGIVKVDEPDSTVLGCLEIGWRFRSDVAKQGFATEAAIASLYAAWEKEDDPLRIVSRTSVCNIPSWRLMARLGMRHDPRLDYLDRHGDTHIVHVLTYSDWNSSSLPDPRL